MLTTNMFNLDEHGKVKGIIQYQPFIFNTDKSLQIPLKIEKTNEDGTVECCIDFDKASSTDNYTEQNQYLNVCST